MPVNNALTPEGQNALGAAFGYYPQLRRNRTVQDPRLAAEMPLQFLRGRVAATAGAIPDILNLVRSPMPMEMYGDVDYGQQAQVPYGSQELLRTLPLPPQGAAQQAAANVGAVVPLTPMEALQAARAARQAAFATGRTLGPAAAGMAEGYLQRQGLMPGVLPPGKYVGKTLEGMPDVVNVGGRMEQFGTDQRLVDIAKSYVSDKGLVYSPQTKYATIDEGRANRLARAYEGMVNNPNDPKVKKAYNAMIDETMAQYEALRKKGYKFDFMPESGDIYGNPRNAINDIVQNKRLSIFPTEQGFGGPSAAVASEANPLLMRTGETWSGKPVTANDVFRAVHDVFGHGKHGVGFRAAGEENAFQSHARMYSPEALPAATSETRGQNSWVNFGPYGQSNRTASPLATEYAEQKTGIMPAWTWREGFLK